MKSIATAVSTINVPFHGAELYVVNHNGEPYTPMKPIVEVTCSPLISTPRC